MLPLRLAAIDFKLNVAEAPAVFADLGFNRVARDVFTSTDQMSLNVERDSFGTVSAFLLSTSRVRNLRFLKITGIVGSFGGY